jgi:hypothetical protein
MKYFFPLVLLVVFLLGVAGPARACSCAVLEPDQLLEFAPIAFVGTVTGVTPGGTGDGTVAYAFEVETVLAGEAPSVATVTTADNSAACGFEAALGTRMAIFATDEGNGDLRSGLCSTTDADLAIKELGPGIPPTGPGHSGPAGAAFDWQAVWLGAGGLLVVAGVWLSGRRQG